MKVPTTENMRMLYGFLLLIILAGLAFAISLGKVYEQSSYGLMPLLVAITSLATTFANWAFRPHDEDKKDKDDTANKN